ncbi:helix-turn-helix transcriptional regulator [Candidatus Nomurabacteria bacterium]|nr:helix-turn-helix transcriptional regulator [Candidatus Nomurabacteria bacterium]
MKNNLSNKIKSLRKKAGLNQTEMAKAIGVHLQTISRYEQGKLIPSMEILSVLAEKFNVTADWLFAQENENVVAEGHSEYSEINAKRLHKMTEKLARIYRQGDERKLKAIESQLDLLDPGEKHFSYGTVREITK